MSPTLPLTAALSPLATEQGVVPYSATSFEAFRVTNIGDAKRPKWRTYTLPPIEADSLDEALADALCGGQAVYHKDQIIIRETGEQGAKLHLYAIKRKSSPTYLWEDHTQKRVNRLYADPVCTIDGGILMDSLTKGTVE